MKKTTQVRVSGTLGQLVRLVRKWERSANNERSTSAKALGGVPSNYARGVARAFEEAADDLRATMGKKRLHDEW